MTPAVSEPSTPKRLFTPASAPLWSLVLLAFGISLLTLWQPGNLFWHDWQRIGQILLVGVAAGYLSTRPIPNLSDRHSQYLLLAVIAGGLLSAVLAHQPLWALAEVALLTGCLVLLMATAAFRHTYGPRLDSALLMAVITLCSLKILLFLISYTVNLLVGQGTLNPWRLLQGFSNMRFYGQFQTLTLPLLVLPLLVPAWRRFALPALVLLGLWWTLAIASGTRGTWMAMATAMLVLSVASAAGRRWAGWQLLGATAGLTLVWLLFNALPEWSGMAVGSHPAERLNTSMSLRDLLWQQAWSTTLANPLLGAGPMHFAEVDNGNAVHPHNALLQWSSEWGIPSTLLMAWLFWRMARAVLGRLKAATTIDSTRGLYVCLSASVLAGLAQAMVDGMIVMPFTQIWFSVLAGWLLALHGRQSPSLVTAPWRLLAVLATGLLVFVLVRDAGSLTERARERLDTGQRLMPRFWQQGLIGDGQKWPAGTARTKGGT